ncbi:hypothetical protein SAMD00019534_092610 [Acytostelium subglobosum LB1]|uniref:hypothetical protein n=1 Tax=Acytostelium subglobosum LB1 TaxID=1410327 RepID=UPI0006448C32|nr:hypothetical protein SAMD00019534_092610 [Acytostelium subglobosum LB1]GAM26086.1 hypothetical protein SAMD00019534_092610 [Acytostelium subglobosum LB1]|eukprot:XP_012751129.1 hypothetical protein SAMD00019534_092610 [Acytostelium subglobosum LB1]
MSDSGPRPSSAPTVNPLHYDYNNMNNNNRKMNQQIEANFVSFIPNNRDHYNANNNNGNMHTVHTPPLIAPTFTRPQSTSLQPSPSNQPVRGRSSSNASPISPSLSSSPSKGSISSSTSVSGSGSGGLENTSSRPPNRPPPPAPTKGAKPTQGSAITSSTTSTAVSTTPASSAGTPTTPSKTSKTSKTPTPKKNDQPTNGSWVSNIFKKLTSSSVDLSEIKWDTRKTNGQIIKVEDNLNISYISPHSGQIGIARASVGFSNSFNYFEILITGKEGKICFGLSSGEHPLDVFPGFAQGSYGYYCDGKVYLGNATPTNYGQPFSSGDLVGCGVDNNKSLYFTKNGVYLGTACKKVHVSGHLPTVGMQSAGESIVGYFAPPFRYNPTEKQSPPVQPAATEDLIPKDELEQEQWSSNRCAPFIQVRERSARISTRFSHNNVIGIVQSTHPVHEGSFFYFEVTLENVKGKMVSVGLAGDDYPLTESHVGWKGRSYGYHSDDGRKFKWHNDISNTNRGESYGPSFGQGDTIGCGVVSHQMFFTKNGTFLGLAFSDVYGQLYPTVGFNEPGDCITATFSAPFKFQHLDQMVEIPTPLIISSNGSVGSSSNSISNSVSFSSIVHQDDGQQTTIFPSKSMPSLSSLEHVPLPPIRAASPHSYSLPGAGAPISSFSSLSSYSSSNGSLSSSSSNSIPPPNYSSLHPNSFTNSNAANRHCISLPSAASNTTTLASSMSFGSTSPSSSPKSSSPRKILNSSDELTFVQQFQDVDGQPPSAWRRYGSSISCKDDTTLSMAKFIKKTGAAIANRPFPSSTTTLCYFEVYIEGFYKKSTVSIGLAHAQYPLDKHIGRMPMSFGYCSTGEKFGYNGKLGDLYGPTFTSASMEPVVIGCGINNTTREIFFTRNGEYLGVAFWRVPTAKPLYPAISMKHLLGGMAVTSFSAPFKFNFDQLPGVSPSYWTESLGPDRGNKGFLCWTPNDVAVWLDAIGKGQYQKVFCDNNIKGRHLLLFTIENLKSELGIEIFAHRADIIERVNHMIEIWKDRGGTIQISDNTSESSDDERLKKRWPDQQSGSFEIAHSQGILRPVKIYSPHQLEDRTRRSTISGGESPNKQRGKHGGVRSRNIGASEDSPFEEERQPTSMTLSVEQVRYLMDKKVDEFEVQSSRPHFHTFTPQHINVQSIKTSNSSSRSNSPTFNLPPIVHQQQQNLPPLMPTHTSSPMWGAPVAQSQEMPPPQSFELSSSPKPNSIIKSSQPPLSQFSSSSSPWDGNSVSSSLGLSPEYEIDFSELEFGPVLGKGFFGEVKRGYWRETDVAIKTIYRDQFKTKSSLEMFQNEVSILSKVRHPNVVQFLGACTAISSEQCIVIEWMGGGSLREFLDNHFDILELNPKLRLKIALDIAKGMNYLHGRTPPILHRDLSSRNILLDNPLDTRDSYKVSDFKCKISDFGLSRLKMEQSSAMTASVGCFLYMAPEVYTGEANSEKSDVYSFSMVLWELITAKELQQMDMNPMKMANLAANENYRPVLPMTTSTKWKELIASCWDANPANRPTFRQIIIQLKEMEEQGESSYAPIPVSNVDIGFYG